MVGTSRLAGPPRVVVVGGGVSGCACAAALASSGARVTVLSRALDSVGQPGYGPVVTAGSGGWERIVDTIGAVPAVLRDAWLNASVASDTGAAFFCVDRRMVSVEAKRALEGLPGLEFRQGLAIGVRTGRVGPEGGRSSESSVDGGLSQHGRVVVETAFGEEIEADAVVVAVGLSLGGRVRAGDDVLPGGRCGEMSADGLRVALEGLGARFRDATVEVGPRFSRASGEGTGVIPLRVALDGKGQGKTPTEEGGSQSGEGRRAWPADYPPAPHWTEELAPDRVVVGEGAEGEVIPVVCPDGVATGEVYLSRGACGSGDAGSGESEGPEPRRPASRLEHTVTGLAITNAGPTGRLGLGGDSWPAIWVAGRAGGAVDYLDSVASGVRVAGDVAKVVGRALLEDRANGRREAR